MFNKYSRVARAYPAILCSIPIFVLNYFLINSYAGNFLAALSSIKWAGGVTLSLALTFLLAQAARFVGKELFEKLHFNDELSMPTTQMLLHNDHTYSAEHKAKIHAKIYKDFQMKVCTIAEEDRDNRNARKTIVECVSLIRTKVKDGRLLLQHNIEYGFVRNLIGGSAIAVFISELNLWIFGYFFPNSLAFYISLFAAIIYLLVIVFGRFFIDRYGINYAKILIQEFLSLE